MPNTMTLHRSLCEAAESLTDEAEYCASNANSCTSVGLAKLAGDFHSHEMAFKTAASLLRSIARELTSKELDAARETHAGVIAQIEGTT